MIHQDCIPVHKKKKFTIHSNNNHLYQNEITYKKLNMGYALKLLPKASDEGIHLKHEQTPVYSIPPPLPATKFNNMS